ncbi:sugar ABC transporter ATP-binding protein [Arthrobacter sp. MI7-26]|uniref:sugar ABC transporter ATP-binding protein n=1 Tax=Arthrobacter sp. MI7-26 TaxID=2993653 RepID=UPI00224929F3|nr:sugar ABC transporter ATP-binding protein [Arthrobacter sp. MI7-26]MCX2749993.1 sugar ABC transporter ATP-binding protein [Arthrobacter sp. MI7-26]
MSSKMKEDLGPLLSAKNVSKTFGGRTVLRGVDLEINRGEVHGLLGQNGSGKSTLIKILAGYHQPDPGATVEFDGRQLDFPLSLGSTGGLGMSFVHQDLALVPDATITENLRLGRYETGPAWRVSWRSENRKVAESLERFGIDAGPDSLVRELRPVEQALIAILRALEELRQFERGVLVLDEPTAYLPRDGVGRLFEAVRDIASQDFGVIFVSHRLDEVQALTDRVSILRDGSLIGTETTALMTEQDLISSILGFELEELYPATARTSTAETACVLRGVSGSVVKDVSFDIRRGEVVGITGLVGMGWEELPYLLFGAERAVTGSLTTSSHPEIDIAKLTPKAAMARKIALLPADRRRDGAVADATASENLTLPTLRNHFISGRLRRREELAHTHRLMQQFQVRPPTADAPLGTFSGGNQQKVLLAKWFETEPEIFIMHEPTQGVDVGARKQIFEHIQTAAANGTGVLLASAEYEDLAHLCDRVLVFRHGRIVAELEHEALTQDRIVERCYSESSARSA